MKSASMATAVAMTLIVIASGAVTSHTFAATRPAGRVVSIAPGGQAPAYVAVPVDSRPGVPGQATPTSKAGGTTTATQPLSLGIGILVVAAVVIILAGGYFAMQRRRPPPM